VRLSVFLELCHKWEKTGEETQAPNAYHVQEAMIAFERSLYAEISSIA
jgi:hypothetical protein